MISDGIPRPVVVKDLGLNKTTLDKWIRAERRLNPNRFPAWLSMQPATRTCKVGVIRTVLRMVDEKQRMRTITAETGVDRQTVRRWRMHPRFREATLEYDPLFSYDHTDLLDRAVVAQHLCSQTPDVDERLDLLMAAVSSPEQDEFSVPYRKTTRRKGA